MMKLESELIVLHVGENKEIYRIQEYLRLQSSAVSTPAFRGNFLGQSQHYISNRFYERSLQVLSTNLVICSSMEIMMDSMA